MSRSVPATEPEAYFKNVFDYARKLDPQKRPRTYAIVMMSLPDNSKGQRYADFLSLNRYYGWYVMGGMELCRFPDHRRHSPRQRQ